MSLRIEAILAPWVHGWQHAKAVFADNVTIEAHRCLFDEHQPPAEAPSLRGRIKHIVATIALWFPLVNYICEYVFRLLAPKPLEQNPEEEDDKIKAQKNSPQTYPAKPTADPKTPTVDPKAPQNETTPPQVEPITPQATQKFGFESIEPLLFPIFLQLVDKLKEMVRKREDHTTVNYYNQYIENLFKIPAGNNVKARFQLVAWTVQKLLFEEYGLPKELMSYVAYRLWNEFSLTLLQAFVTSKDHWDVIEVPGDGNCMLWSIVVAQKVAASPAADETFHALSSFKNLHKNHPNYQELHDEMVKMRNLIATTCADLLNNPNNVDLRRQFVYYVLGDSEVSKAVIGQEDQEQLLLSGVPTASMVERYGQFVMTTEKWNGEFEAEIISRIIRKPIVILRGDTNGKMPLGTIAGGQYFEESDVNPIFIRLKPGHYDCLF